MTLFSATKTSTLTTSLNYYSATLLQYLLHLLHLSIHHQSLSLAHQCHARALSIGLTSHPFFATKLISAYAAVGAPVNSQLVFDSLRVKSARLWNALINGYVKNREFDKAFGLFSQMGCSGFSPDDFTLSSLCKVSGETGDLNAGKLVHGKSIKLGFLLDVVVGNSILAMYSKCGEFGECLKLFDEMPERNVGSWNVVVARYADYSGGSYLDVIVPGFVKRMQIEGLRPDAFTVSSLLPLCGEGGGKWDYGRELHGFVVRNELGLSSGSDFHLGCCLIDMYFRSKKVDVGKRVFDQMKRRNVYAWTALINGYVQNGDFEEALTLFREMRVSDGVEPNRVSLVSVLPACSSLAGLIIGKQIHGYAIRKEMNCEVSLCNSLIDMYSKCGSLNCARQVFENGSFHRDAISWSSMISGYGLHGKGEEAIAVYDNMLQLGNKPDMIILVGVLSACARSGFVDEGLHIYKSAIHEYGIEPTVEICACVVDMLGRSGQLDRALDFIKTMPMEPVPSVWGALVSASIMHGNSKMQDLAYRFLIRLEPQNPSNYIALSNVHASSKRWDVVAEVRTLMKERGLRKTPGCSWINISNETHCFYAADKVHPCLKSIYEMLDGLVVLMKGVDNSSDVRNLA